MDEFDVMALARMFARSMLDYRDTIDGITFIRTGKVMSTAELCRVGREAIGLIERGVIK